MKRRGFVKLGATAAVLGGVPAFIERAFAQDRCADDTAAIAEVASGYRRARATGRPLLVLVVPEQEDIAADERAHAFGELLNHGGDEALAMLSLAEVVAARLAHVRRVAPSAPAPSEEGPVLVLIETDRLPARVSAHTAPIPSLSTAWVDGDTWETKARRDEQRIDERIAALTDLVRNALVPDAAAIGRRVAQSEAIPSLAERPAVQYQRAMAASGERRTQMLHELAERARDRIVEERVPGSRWARSGGCGMVIEGEDVQAMMACGMGHVPERSMRFLYFYQNPY
jgi:hypothetical protein